MNGEALTIQPDGTLTGNTAQIYTNIDDQVTTQGAAIGIQYVLPKNYTIGGNYSYNSLNEDLNAQGFLAEYNTPEHKTNLSFGNKGSNKKYWLFQLPIDGRMHFYGNHLLP